MNNEFAARFWAKVKLTSSCWQWNGARFKHGYGQVRIGKKLILAHRIAWTLTHRNGPGNLDVLHRCDNILCVRPDHLFLGTHADNMRDMAIKGRSSRGEQHSSAKLTWVQVREMRKLFIPGHPEFGGMAFAKKYGMDNSYISAIIRGRYWKEV